MLRVPTGGVSLILSMYKFGCFPKIQSQNNIIALVWFVVYTKTLQFLCVEIKLQYVLSYHFLCWEVSKPHPFMHSKKWFIVEVPYPHLCPSFVTDCLVLLRHHSDQVSALFTGLPWSRAVEF